MKADEVIYAAGYYPFMHSKEEWKKDLEKMSKAGIKLIRTAEIFNTWDRIETKKGIFDFKFLDDFFDECKKYGIKILLGTGTASPPYWIHEKYPEVNITNNHGEQYPNNVSYSWACVNHSGYLKEVEDYLTTLVKRYKDHDSLFAYQIHNEISFPFMPLRDGDVDIYCYCDSCVNKFRDWVKNKYKTLDNLNHAYRWGATFTYHTDWKQVIPPKAKPTSWSSVTRWLDWRLFAMESLVNFIDWQNKIIKTLDKKNITTTNIFFLKSQDPLAVITALDQFEMAKTVDIIGYDLYPGSGNKLEKYPEFSSMFLDMSRSTAESQGKNYWLLETESGPINGWALGPSRNVKGFDLIRNIFEAFGHDAKLALYQGWREWEFQPLHWGGIVDLEGKPTERMDAAIKIGDLIRDNNKLLAESKTPKAQIAIVISKENAIIVNGMGQEEFLLKAMRGSYRIYWEMGFKVDFITPDLIENGYAENYKMIHMPFLIQITEELANNLTDYVEAGGILIGTAKSGMLGEHGWYNYRKPCFGLEDAFGIKVEEVNSNETPKITYKRRNYDGYWHRELLNIKDNSVEVLARFINDDPAITKNSFGKGKAVYFATHSDVAYLEENSSLMYEVLEVIMKDNNIKPEVELDYTNQKYKEIDAHILENEKNGVLIITNYVDKNHKGFFVNNKKKVRLNINGSRIYEQGEDLISEEIIEILEKDTSSYMEIDIIKNETRFIKLKKKGKTGYDIVKYDTI